MFALLPHWTTENHKKGGCCENDYYKLGWFDWAGCYTYGSGLIGRFPDSVWPDWVLHVQQRCGLIWLVELLTWFVCHAFINKGFIARKIGLQKHLQQGAKLIVFFGWLSRLLCATTGSLIASVGKFDWSRHLRHGVDWFNWFFVDWIDCHSYSEKGKSADSIDGHTYPEGFTE